MIFQNVSSIKGNAHFLLEYLQYQGDIKCQRLYYNSTYEAQVSAKNNLESQGFLCVDVPDGSKNSADYRLIADCVEWIAFNPTCNIIVLVLGDWDFAGLISVLTSLGKKVIIFAQKGSENKKLSNLVGNDNFHFINDLPKLVNNNFPSHQNTSIASWVNYNEAVEYLIETVKIIVSEGNSTTFSYVDQLMRKLFPKYHGVASIYLPNGKKFHKFSDFITDVVNSGRIQIQKQELFLK